MLIRFFFLMADEKGAKTRQNRAIKLQKKAKIVPHSLFWACGRQERERERENRKRSRATKTTATKHSNSHLVMFFFPLPCVCFRSQIL